MRGQNETKRPIVYSYSPRAVGNPCDVDMNKISSHRGLISTPLKHPRHI
jgi:hypothetical protein